jgi:pyruvate-formate lyase-activating enzyme
LAIKAGFTLENSQLIHIQKSSHQHIAFNITKSCPLKCRHCITSSKVHIFGDDTRAMPIDITEKCASELQDLRLQGVRRISFTGGEPLLATRQLHILCKSAAKAEIECTIVTSGYWAASKEAANFIVESFPEISVWHLSTDIFHQEFVPLGHILNALNAISNHGRKAVVRMTISDPPTKEEEDVYEIARSHVPMEIPLVVQHIANTGRAYSIDTGVDVKDMPSWPCIPSGMMVNSDGTISPCCSCLAVTRSSCFSYFGNVKSQGLARMYKAWLDDPLLQLMQAVGLVPLLQWVYEAFPDRENDIYVSRNPCICCLKLFSDQAICEELRRRVDPPEIKAKILELNRSIFGEPLDKIFEEGA